MILRYRQYLCLVTISVLCCFVQVTAKASTNKPWTRSYDVENVSHVDTMLCAGDSLLLGGVWYFNNANVTINDGEGNQTFYKIRFKKPLPIELEYDTSEQCGEDGRVKINVIERPEYTYTWSDGVVDVDRVIANTGRYILEASLSENCSVKDTIDILLHAPPQIKVDVDTLRLDEGEMDTIHVQTDTGRRIEWSPSEGLNCSDCWSPILTAKNSMYYVFTVLNPYGCQVSDSVLVLIKPKLALPNVISPNAQEEENRYFGIVGHRVLKYSMQIFDRWGNLLFMESDITPSYLRGWNGMMSDSSYLPGVYTYVIRYVDEDGSEKLLKGTVTVL